MEEPVELGLKRGRAGAGIGAAAGASVRVRAGGVRRGRGRRPPGEDPLGGVEGGIAAGGGEGFGGQLAGEAHAQELLHLHFSDRGFVSVRAAQPEEEKAASKEKMERLR